MEEGLSEFCIKGGVKCGRWNPTTEQVRVLTDLFRAGLRTPTAEQIQRISSQLSFYGKIESKNVFYWFQNHKARERQKRRRVSVEKQQPVHREEKQQLMAAFFTEPDPVQSVLYETDIPIKTLQLFPLKSYERSEEEKVELLSFGAKDMPFSQAFHFSHFISTRDPLDLRLSS